MTLRIIEMEIWHELGRERGFSAEAIDNACANAQKYNHMMDMELAPEEEPAVRSAMRTLILDLLAQHEKKN